MKENVNYQLIPDDNDNVNDTWKIRILEGEYIETIFQFGALELKEESDQLSFNFTVLYSPDDSITSENIGLQKYAGSVLSSILERALDNETNEEK